MNSWGNTMRSVKNFCCTKYSQQFFGFYQSVCLFNCTRIKAAPAVPELLVSGQGSQVIICVDAMSIESKMLIA